MIKQFSAIHGTKGILQFSAGTDTDAVFPQAIMHGEENSKN